ncbi:MAG: S8 family serine peptidase [bacterium]
MRRVVTRIVVAFCFVIGGVVQMRGNEAPKYQLFGKVPSSLLEPGQIVLKFKPHVLAKGTESLKTTGVASFDKKMDRFSVKEVRKLFKHKPIPEGSALPDLSRIFYLTFPTHFDPVRVAREFAKDPSVEYAEPVWVDVVDETPNDPMFNQQTYLTKVKAVQAWDVQHGDSTVVIAINDNGTDWEHPDLYENIWTNEVEANGVPDVDDDGNGYVDDIHGYDLAEDDNNPTNAPQDPEGFWMHGTHTGGIAAAVTNNGIGVAGISWNCEIMPVKASYDSLPRLIHFGYQGIIYAAENGADIISNSWGGFGSFSQTNQDVVDYAYGLGSIVVASAGNSDTDAFHYPSAYANVLGVGWVNNSDIRVATYGISVDVCAPGSNIWNTYPDGSYGHAGGSSMSGPLVAGLCGLVKSQHPDWSNDQIVRQTVLTADNIDAQNPGFEGLLGSGRINAFTAVTATELTEVPAKIRKFDVTATDEVSGDGDGLFERGETVNINGRYRNYSLGTATNFQVTLDTDDPDLTIVDGTSSVGTFPPDTFHTTTDPLAFAIAADADPHMAQLFLGFTADGGLSGADTFSVIIGKMPVLLVDDDDGGNNVEGYYTTIFESLNVLYAVWDHASQGSPTGFILSNFPIVVWSCEWAFPSLDADDRAAIQDYLDNGGNLFLSGQDIGWDFHEGYAAGFEDFYENYLHAIYYADDSPVQTVDGIAGDEIGDGLTFDIYQPGRATENQYPDEIEPAPGASAVFEYAGGQHHKGGIKYAGDHRVIYFGFGFEAIDASETLDPTEFSPVRTEVMTRVLNWVNFISHEPLKDSEDLNSPYPVEVTVTGDISDLIGVTLFWKKEGAPAFSQVAMAHQGDGVYTADIPAAGSEATILYYITTQNPYYEWQSPMGAPDGVYSFQVQPDVTDPEFLRVDQLPDTHLRSASAEVTAKVTDNLGIEEVTLYYRLNEEPLASVPMAPIGMPDEYAATISWSGDYGDVVSYYVEAVDSSSNHNTATSDEYSFQIVPYLLLDDFETGTDGWDLGTGWGLGGFGVDNSTSITDSPEGNYGDNEDNPLTYEETFDLSPCTEAAALTFFHFYTIEEGKDFGYVEASADGENWTILETFSGVLGYPVKKRCTLLEGFCGPGNEAVRIRFRLVSDESGTADGWIVDNITLWFKVERGDVNCDGVINIIDVIGAVNVVLGLDTSSYGQWAADFNEDGQVNIIDAIVLVNWILSNPKAALPDGQASAQVQVHTAPTANGTRGELAVYVQSNVSIAGAQFNLQCGDGVEIGEPVLGVRSSEMTLASNFKAGEAVVVLYSTDRGAIAPGEGPVLTIPFQATEGAKGVVLDDVILVGLDGNQIPIEEIKVASRPEGSMPREYFLSQNYPNPFNPLTSIQYSVVGDQFPPYVTLKIYNLLGQEVRTLVDRAQEPGYYAVTWDGRDGNGDQVSSGVYFYRLTAGVTFTATKRMVLLK